MIILRYLDYAIIQKHHKSSTQCTISSANIAKWKQVNEMIMTTINFAINIGKLKDKEKKRGKNDNKQVESD